LNDEVVLTDRKFVEDLRGMRIVKARNGVPKLRIDSMDIDTKEEGS
jgi:hypothetical protein